MKLTLRSAVMAALLLAAGNSWALGLGQIQIKSKRHQPLLAVIPIVSTTPGELAKLQARLASPETFRRIGLAPPSGIAADLQFSLGSDAQGRPIIRVTTLQPVEQSALNFLIEVDWGKGRLVREYSVLVDAPNTAGAGVQPAVQMAQAPEASVVQRPAAPAPAVVAQPLPDAPAAAPTAEPKPAGAAIVPTPAPVATPEPEPSAAVAAAPAAMAPPAAAADAGDGTWRVQVGQTLSGIASKLPLRDGFSLNQTMLALLRANPEAFLDDNINRLTAGSVLRVPARTEVAGIDADEARQVVREQMRQWRQARRAVSQPVAAAASGGDAKAKPDAKPTAKPDATAAATSDAKPAAAPAPQRQDARLRIVPPAGAVKGNGTKSGNSAGGEGSMLQQELQQRDEDIAAKTAEIGELKDRIAALEKLKDEQQKLIAMKSSEMAAVQARLAASQNAKAQPAAGSPVAPADAPAVAPWLWGGLGVLVLALLAWLLGRRRGKPAAPVRRSVFDSAALAASMPAMAQPEAPAPEAPADGDAPEARTPGEHTPVEVAVDLTTELPAAPQGGAPNWHSGWVRREPAAEAVPEQAAQPAQPAEIAPEPASAPEPALSAQASTEQRFKMAKAFIESGDEASAQQLLLDLLDDENSDVSDEAARILSKLVG